MAHSIIDRLSENPILAAHVNELDPAYRIFDGVTDNKLRAEVAQLVDFLRQEEITVPLDVPASAIPYLRAAAVSAHPNRKCLTLLAGRFGSWLSLVNPDSKQAFLEGIAALSPAIADLGDAGMKEVAQAVNRDSRLMAAIGCYALTTKPIIQAVVKLALVVPAALIQRLVNAVPVSVMENDKDAERLTPALARVPEAMAAIVNLAEHSPSSAYGACQGLPGALKLLRSEEERAEFLEHFELLTATVGISSVGFAVNSLPGCYARLGRERTREFVSLAAECARQFGRNAGQAFLERRTPASRQAP
jgi:hypothetical protein